MLANVLTLVLVLVLSNVLVKGIQSVLRGESASTKELLLLLSQGKAVLYCCFRLH
jgi:hypothetical protein